MTNKSEIIAQQNDMFRQNFGMSLQDYIQGTPSGRYVVTSGIQCLGLFKQSEVHNKVRNFNDFNEDNDPHGEHDYGSFQLENNKQKIIWKIDYYDTTYEYGSEDPADLSKTRRVLTVMLPSEY